MEEDYEMGSILDRIMNELQVVEYRRKSKWTHDAAISTKSFVPGSLKLWLITYRRRNLLWLPLCCCFSSTTILSNMFLLFQTDEIDEMFSMSKYQVL